MTGLEPPDRARSQDAGAHVDDAAFRSAGVSPSEYAKYVSPTADGYRVKIPPAALDYLRTVPAPERDPTVIRALKFAKLNGRPRSWSTDFALAGGCVTLDDVIAWHAARGIKVRSSSFGSIRRA